MVSLFIDKNANYSWFLRRERRPSLLSQVPSTCLSVFNMASIDVAVQTVNPGKTALAWDNNLRIASMTLAAYEYVATHVRNLSL